MSKTTFLTLCNELLISPDVALENEELQAALASHNNAEVKRILEEEF